MRRLKTRIAKDGVLRVISQQTRSQTANRELAVERVVELMQDALRLVPIRRRRGPEGCEGTAVGGEEAA